MSQCATYVYELRERIIKERSTHTKRVRRLMKGANADSMLSIKKINSHFRKLKKFDDEIRKVDDVISLFVKYKFW